MPRPGVAVFPKEIVAPVRKWIEASYSLRVLS
jgi:hypothetical protein